MTVKVIEYAKFGAPFDVCKCIVVDDPASPQENEVLVAVEASAINPADLLMIRGEYPGPKTLPTRQGIEGVGRIIAIGSDVKDYIVGDLVLLLGRGNWVEKVVCSADQVVRIPEDIDLLQAAQMKANPPSAYFMLHDFVDLEEGDWIIQNAANSAVGQHVIRLAKQMGVKTINIVRRAESISILKAIGADFVFVDGDDLGERVRSEIGDTHVPLAIDAAGGKPCEHLADCLSNGGVVVNYGFLDGKPCMITPTHTIVRQISLTGFWLFDRLSNQSKEEIKNIYTEMSDLFVSGVLHSPVEATYRLDQVTKALAHAERGGRDGKILFLMKD
jgi:trans-2-enoyl-CoA reductase